MMVRLSRLSDAELIELYSDLMTELVERGIVRSGNNPIADIAERLVANYYGVDLEPQSQKGFDLRTKDGERIQVKAARRSARGGFALSAFRSEDFDSLAVLLFESDYQLTEAFLVPIAAFKEHRGWSETLKAHRLGVTKALRFDSRVIRLAPEDLASNG